MWEIQQTQQPAPGLIDVGCGVPHGDGMYLEMWVSGFVDHLVDMGP